MTRFRYFAVLSAAVGLLGSCGGKQSMASRSAAAYRHAVAKGVAVGAEGHGHAVAHEGSTQPEMQGMNHAQMQPGSMKGMQHGSMADMKGHATMKHEAMPGMEHGTIPGMEHGTISGMQHGATPGMQHGTPSAASVVINAPSSSSGIAELSPSSTLRQDPFDQPAPVAVQEAQKGRQQPAHEGHQQ